MSVERIRSALQRVAAIVRQSWRAATVRRRATGAGLVLAVGVALSILVGRNSSGDEFEEHVVRRGHLRVAVPVAGLLVPCRAESYGGEIPGVEMKVRELAPEGEQVTAGAVVIRFDDAPFQAALAEATSKRITAENEAEQARQGLRAAAATERSAILEAEAGLTRAEAELKAFVSSGASLEVQKSEVNLERSRREAQEAQTKYEGLSPFAEKGYISQEEYRAARMRAEQTAADLGLAEKQHRNLLEHAQPLLLAGKTAEAATRRETLKNLKQRSAAQLAQAQAAAELAQGRAQDSARLESEARRRIELCEVRARSSGLVVYREIFDRAGVKRRVRTGDTVFSGQPILDLPDLSCMLLEARIQEGDIYRVARDQKAEIRLDAFPDSVFQGAVAALGALTVAEKSESRSFPLRVQVLGSDSRLRPGMAARATIDCGDIDNALLVPVDAVQISGDQKSCLVRGLAGGATRRLIKTGKSNTFFFEVAAGLKEGETVLVQRH